MKNIPRLSTKQIKIGNITIGGQNKVLIQSMCNIKTSHVSKVIKQINECAEQGADLMRVSVLDEKDAKAIKKIKKGINIPLVADIHFNYKFAILAIRAGADAIRINPGNIGGKKEITAVINECKKYGTVIRIGVNSGSVCTKIDEDNSKITSDIMIKSVKKMLKIFKDNDFDNIVLSIKGSDVLETVKAYRLASKKFKYPLHLGITEAGPKEIGTIRSSAGLAPLLIDGIGDTIRISLSDDPVEEIKACKRLLRDLGIIGKGPRLISCPTCGRTQVNLIPLATKILDFIETNDINVTVAVMGCVVNGPGEAKRADIGIAGGKGVWVLFKKGVYQYSCKDELVYDTLIKELLKYK